MSDSQPSSLPGRNPATYQAHRQEVLWQITIPFIVMLLVIVAFAVLLALGSGADQSKWADVSLIWLILPMLLITLIFTLILAALIYAVVWLIRKMPGFALQAQDLVFVIEAKVRQVSDKAVEPIIRAQSMRAAVRAFRRGLTLRRRF